MPAFVSTVKNVQVISSREARLSAPEEVLCVTIETLSTLERWREALT